MQTGGRRIANTVEMSTSRPDHLGAVSCEGYTKLCLHKRVWMCNPRGDLGSILLKICKRIICMSFRHFSEWKFYCNFLFHCTLGNGDDENILGYCFVNLMPLKLFITWRDFWITNLAGIPKSVYLKSTSKLFLWISIK